MSEKEWNHDNYNWIVNSESLVCKGCRHYDSKKAICNHNGNPIWLNIGHNVDNCGIGKLNFDNCDKCGKEDKLIKVNLSDNSYMELCAECYFRR